MRRGERMPEPTARARSGHAACEAAFFLRRWSRHASRPALPFPWCGGVFRARRERTPPVCGRPCTPRAMAPTDRARSAPAALIDATGRARTVVAARVAPGLGLRVDSGLVTAGARGRQLRRQPRGAPAAPKPPSPVCVVGGGRRVDRSRPVGGGGARPSASWSSDVGSAHCANKAVASLRICSPASRAPVAGSLRGSRGCPEHMRIKAPLYPTPPAHPSFRQQSRQWAVAALMGAGRVAHHGFRSDRGRLRPPIVTILAGHSGPPLHRPLRGLGGAALVRRAHDAPRGFGRGSRALVSRWRQATGRAKRRCAPRFAGSPFGTSGGVGPSHGMAFGPCRSVAPGGHRWPPSFLAKGGQRCHAPKKP